MYINLSLFLQSLSKCAVKKYEKKKNSKNNKRFTECSLFLRNLKQLFPASSISIFFCLGFSWLCPLSFIPTFKLDGLMFSCGVENALYFSLLFFTFSLKQKAAYLSSKHVPLKYRKTLCNAKRPYDWTLHIANLYLAFN